MSGLNKIETAENARRFLGGEFQIHRRKAKLASVLPSSPRWIDEPRGGGGVGNATDDRLVEYVHSKTIVEAVNAVIDVMADEDGKIIKRGFIDCLDDIVLMERLDLARSTFYDKKQAALVEFADLFHGIIDLREYNDGPRQGELW